MIGIYKITSPTGKIYIGQSVDIHRRKIEHQCYNKFLTSKLQNSIKKHGFENHIFETLEECSIELLNERERHFQDLYDVLGPNGLNLVLTKTTDKKMVHSDETKEKLRQFNLGKTRVVSKETRVKMSKNFKGRIHSEKTKEVLRNLNLGKTLTDEVKTKISEGGLRSGSKRCKKVINTETGEVFRSISKASKSCKVDCTTLAEKLRGVKNNDTVFEYYNH